MIKTYQELKEAFCDFNDNNDDFPSVDVLQNTSDYSLVYTGQEPIERKDFELPISWDDFEILLAEFWDYIDDYLSDDSTQEKSSNPIWDNNEIQFARFIHEAWMAGAFTKEITDLMLKSMDLEESYFNDIIQRAEAANEAVVKLL